MKQTKSLPTCPACKLESSKIIGKHREYKLLGCSKCGLRYCDPMKEPDQNFYQNSYLYKHRSKELETTATTDDGKILRNWRFKTTLEDMQNRFSTSVVKDVLDIGCGEGSFLYAASKRGFKVSGVDIDPRAVNIAKQLFRLKDVKVANLSDLPTKERYKVITLFETLEHTQDPSSLVRKVFTLLENDSYFYISVPSFERKPRLFDPEADFPPHHLTLWTKKSLRILLEKAGFKKISILEKPLSGEDLQLHLIWWVKRQLGGKEVAAVLTKSESKGVSLKVVGKRLIGLLSLIIFEILAFIIRLSGVSRGQTYLVLASKEK